MIERVRAKEERSKEVGGDRQGTKPDGFRAQPNPLPALADFGPARRIMWRSYSCLLKGATRGFAQRRPMAHKRPHGDRVAMWDVNYWLMPRV